MRRYAASFQDAGIDGGMSQGFTLGWYAAPRWGEEMGGLTAHARCVPDLIHAKTRRREELLCSWSSDIAFFFAASRLRVKFLIQPQMQPGCVEKPQLRRQRHTCLRLRGGGFRLTTHAPFSFSGFFRAFFSSDVRRRSTFLTSSAGGRLSGRMPRLRRVSRTALLLATCSREI